MGIVGSRWGAPLGTAEDPLTAPLTRVAILRVFVAWCVDNFVARLWGEVVGMEDWIVACLWGISGGHAFFVPLDELCYIVKSSCSTRPSELGVVEVRDRGVVGQWQG